MKAPGDCTPDEYAALNWAVNSACKTGAAVGSCDVTDSCAVLNAKVYSKWACIAARFARDIKCWRNGDVGHQGAVAQKVVEIVKCQGVIAAKCPGLMPTGPGIP